MSENISFNSVMKEPIDELNDCLIRYCKNEKKIPDTFEYIPIGNNTACLNIFDKQYKLENNWLKNIPKELHNFVQNTTQKIIEIDEIYDYNGKLVNKNHLLINPFEELENVRCFLLPKKFDKNDYVKWKIKCGKQNIVKKLKRVPAKEEYCMRYSNDICNGFNVILDIYINEKGDVIKTIPTFSIKTLEVKSLNDIAILTNMIENLEELNINGMQLNLSIENKNKILYILNITYKFNQILKLNNIQFTNIKNVSSNDVETICNIYEILFEKNGVVKESSIMNNINFIFDRDIQQEIIPEQKYIFFYNGHEEYDILGQQIKLYTNQILCDVNAINKGDKIEIKHNQNSSIIKHYHIDKNNWIKEYQTWISSNRLELTKL